MAEIMTAKEAVERYIHTGTQVCWGGFSYTRRPFTICREVIRQRGEDYRGIASAVPIFSRAMDHEPVKDRPYARVARIDGEIRQAKIQHQVVTHESRGAAGDVGVTGKIAVDLKREGVNREQNVEAIDG